MGILDFLTCFIFLGTFLLTPNLININGNPVIIDNLDISALSEGAYIGVDVSSMIKATNSVDLDILSYFPAGSVRAELTTVDNKKITLFSSSAYSSDSENKIELILRSYDFNSKSYSLSDNLMDNGMKFKSLQLESDVNMKNVMVYWHNCTK